MPMAPCQGDRPGHRGRPKKRDKNQHHHNPRRSSHKRWFSAGSDQKEIKIPPALLPGMRIDVNSEFEVLYEFLKSCRVRARRTPRSYPSIPGGPAGEKSFQFFREGVYQEIAWPDPSSAEECNTNSRARSAACGNQSFGLSKKKTIKRQLYKVGSVP